MITPDELDKKSEAVRRLRDHVAKLERARALTNCTFYYSGYSGKDAEADEIERTRRALVDYWQNIVALDCEKLRTMNVDASSIYPGLNIEQ